MKKLTARLLAFAVVAAACVATARAGGEGYFVKKATWVETIVASREALSAREARARQDLVDDKHGFQPVEVKISGKDSPRSVKLSLAGLRKIYISCESGRQVLLARIRQSPRGRDRQSLLASVVLNRAEIELNLSPQADNFEVAIGLTDGKKAPITVRFDHRSEGEFRRTHEGAMARIYALTEAALAGRRLGRPGRAIRQGERQAGPQGRRVGQVVQEPRRPPEGPRPVLRSACRGTTGTGGQDARVCPACGAPPGACRHAQTPPGAP